MKKILLTAILLGGAMFAKAQSTSVIVGAPVNQVMTATTVTQTADGFQLSGNISTRPATPKELEVGSDGDGGSGPGATVMCGFWHNWICGVAKVVTDPNYPMSWILCEGTSGKCAKVSSK